MWGHGRTVGIGRALVAAAVVVSGLLVTLGAPAHADGTPPPEAFILVDAGTGAVITGRNMHEALPPASTAKIMTALVAIERLPPDATIPVSANAAGREAMKIGMTAGTRWPFSEVMASLMLVSANDAAYALAESVGGSIPGFAADLNATAKRYGMRDSTFGDPAGLSDATSYEGGPKVSAYDLAIATRNALTVPAIADWAATRTYQFTDPTGLHHSLTSHDHFLPDNGFGYVGANGFKTGYTALADHTLVATAKRNGRQCIAVILGSVDSGYTWAASLLDQCWTGSNVATTGKLLPPVAVSPYASRVAQRSSFVSAAEGKSASLLATPTSAPRSGTTAPRSSRSTTTTTAPAAKKHHGGGVTTRAVIVLLFLALAGAFVLRRRAVRRQRARRIARQRARAKAMRSGSLPVVDGRYRTGMRVGPPVESNVRVERTFIDLTKEEAKQRPPRRRTST